jgi:hypothetical protein
VFPVAESFGGGKGERVLKAQMGSWRLGSLLLGSGSQIILIAMS